MITLTNEAAEQVKILLDKQNDSSLGLRLSINGGGCSGFQYDMGFDMAGKDDEVIDTYGFKVFVDSVSYKYLEDIIIDFQVTTMGQGFKFENPNAKRSCGCGKSFSV